MSAVSTLSCWCSDLRSLEEEGLGEAHSPAIADRPADHAPCVALGADLQREDLSWVKPGDSKPRSTKSHTKNESERSSSRAELPCFVGIVEGGSREAAREEHGDTHDEGTEVEGGAASEAVKSEDCEEG